MQPIFIAYEITLKKKIHVLQRYNMTFPLSLTQRISNVMSEVVDP